MICPVAINNVEVVNTVFPTVSSSSSELSLLFLITAFFVVLGAVFILGKKILYS